MNKKEKLILFNQLRELRSVIKDIAIMTVGHNPFPMRIGSESELDKIIEELEK